jgi:AcrR family transcriptional regulator
MPRAGLNTSEVVASGAELADEVGIRSVSFAALAERLGVKAPALYKHVDSIGDLRHRIATLAMTELGDTLRDTLQGKSGAAAIGALFTAVQSYIAEHPGRYNATTGAQFQGREDPLLAATTRVVDSIRAVLSGYGIRPDELDHAIRMLRCAIHGYAVLQAANAFQWSNDPDESVAWMIRFFDAGLTAVGDKAPYSAHSS